MKLLNIHERVACGIPCIIEGETGVSKTALTKMYSILINSSNQAKAKEETHHQLQEVIHTLKDKNMLKDTSSDEKISYECLLDGLSKASPTQTS